MKRRFWAGALIALSMAGTASAQDIHFSQFYETSILRNPALTGVFAGDYKIGATYKSQWSSIANPYETAMISAETRFSVNEDINDFISFGLLSYYDRAGSIRMQTVTVYPAVNYNKLINQEHSSYLSAGFTGGFVQRSYDASRATFNNQYQNNQFNADNPTGEQGFDPSITHFDLGAGISFSTNTGINNQINYFFGVSGYHFTRPNRSFYNSELIRLGIKINVTGGITMPIGEQASVQAYANYTQQSTYQEIIAGGLLGWSSAPINSEEISFAIYGGLFYRLKDAVVPTVKIRMKTYTLGLSYDVNVSKLRVGSGMRGGYELTLFKTGLFKAPGSERGTTICPRAI